MNQADPKLSWYLEKIKNLQNNPELEIGGFKKEGFLKLINFLFGPILDENKKPVSPTHPRFLDWAIRRLGELEQTADLKLEKYLEDRGLPPERIKAAISLPEPAPETKGAPPTPAPTEPHREAPPAIKPEKEIKEVVSAPAKIYQAVPRIPGVKTIRRAVYQKVIRPIVTRFLKSRLWKRLAKTAVGKAIKAGIKVAVKQGVKQGVKAGVQAAITAAGISAAGVGVIVSVVINAAIEVASWIAEKVIKRVIVRIKTIIEEPEKALAMAGVGVLAVILIPAPLGIIIGVPLVALGGLGFVAGAGVFLGGLAVGVTAFFAGLAAPFAVPIALFVVGLLVGLATITFFIVMTTAGAFIVPSEPTEAVSEYFEVDKTVSRNEIPNDELSEEPCVTYRVEVTADQPIEITSIVDIRTIVCGPGNTYNPQVLTPVDVPAPSGQITSWTSDPYELCFDDTFFDCRVCNTVTVTAIVGGETGQRASDTECVNIGTPPEDCPSGWPTDHGYITQGPNANWSHQGQEAIDIGVIVGTPVKATHDGIVTDITGFGFDKRVHVRGECEGMFRTFYIHLASVSNNIQEGGAVSRGDPIGTSGEYNGEQHLHYEFVNLEMANPYIPIIDDILRGCCGSVPLCTSLCSDHGVTW